MSEAGRAEAATGTSQTSAPSGVVAQNAQPRAAKASHHKPKKKKHKKKKKKTKTVPPPTATLSLAPQTVPYSGGQITLTYSATNATTCTLAASPAFWTGSNPATVSCNSSYQGTLPLTLSSGQWTFTFTATSAGGKRATSTQTLTQQSPSFQQSLNWSGYVVPSSTVITEVSGDFVVPTLNCSQTPNAWQSTWDGLGGDGGNSGDLLQTGVESDCVGGVQTDTAGWWELVPPLPEIPFGSMLVSPGDQIAAYTYEWNDGSRWETCVDDLTTGVSGLMVTGEGWGVTTGGCGGTFSLQGSTSGYTYAGATTAEWVEEDTCDLTTSSYAPLADFGTVAFTNLTTSLSPWSLTPAEQIAIVQGGTVLALPSAPDSTGDGFSVTFLSAGAGAGSATCSVSGPDRRPLAGYRPFPTATHALGKARGEAPGRADGLLAQAWLPVELR
ncbi:MAG TPA: G1 family glutamic endopeptidase [Gaiellaceae bacterium]|nr:G1 family glutamic endopeptidase [Gaiellaceae bacterium]